MRWMSTLCAGIIAIGSAHPVQPGAPSGVIVTVFVAARKITGAGRAS